MTRSNVHQTAAASSTALLVRSADAQLFEIARAANESYDTLSSKKRKIVSVEVVGIVHRQCRRSASSDEEPDLAYVESFFPDTEEVSS